MKQEWQLRYKLFVRRERGKSVLVSGVKSAVATVARLEWGFWNLTLGLRQIFPVWSAVASATLQSGTHGVFYSHIKSISFYFFSTKVQSKQTDRRKRNRCQCSLDTLFPLWMFLLALRNQKWCLTCALNILISSVPSGLPSRQANSVIQFWHRSDIHYLLLSIIKTLLQMSLWALSFVLTLNACLARFSLMSSFLRIFVNETNLWLRVFGHVFQFHVDSC